MQAAVWSLLLHFWFVISCFLVCVLVLRLGNGRDLSVFLHVCHDMFSMNVYIGHV